MDKELQKELDDSYTYHFFFNHGVYDELKHYEDLISETEQFLKTKVAVMEGGTDEENPNTVNPMWTLSFAWRNYKIREFLFLVN